MFLVWPCVCSVFFSVLPAFTCPFLFLFHSICSLHACRARPRGPASRLPTFPPVRARRRVHRVYSDTADSAATPPDSHAPRRGPIVWRSRSDHAPPRPWLAAARYTFDFDWLRVTTRQIAQNFVSVFFVFFPVLSAEASLLAAAQRSDWSSSHCSRSCRRPFLRSSVRSFSSSTQPRCCQVSFQKLGMLELCGTARGSRTSGFGVRCTGTERFCSPGRVVSARLGCVGDVCWFIWGHSEPSHSCVCARAWAVPTVASLQCIAHRCRNFTDVFFVLVQLMLSAPCRRLISRTGWMIWLILMFSSGSQRRCVQFVSLACDSEASSLSFTWHVLTVL